jgi:hypothetical protein
VVVAVVAVVVDRAVRSAGKAFSFERELGPQRCGPSHFKVRISLNSGFGQLGFTPKSGLPIIAPLGGGPK